MPIVTPQETSELIRLVSSEQHTLQKSYQEFEKHWPFDSANRFRALCFLILSLEEGSFKTASSRLSSLHVLFQSIGGDCAGSAPFLPYLLQASQDQNRPGPERAFIQKLFEGTVSDTDTPLSLFPSLQSSSGGIKSANALWQAYTSRSVTLGSKGSQADTQSAHQRPQGPQSCGVAPPYIHHKQQILPLQPGEAPWQHSQPPYLLRWDSSMLQDQIPVKELQELLQTALSGPLLPVQQQQVLKELELERKLALSLDLSSDAVPHLVEHNPVIAFEVLVRLIQLGKGDDYLPALVNMEVSVHSMEVINRLSTAASLPPQFVHLYISNCIRSCQAAQGDKYMQLRRVRLVCVFLQSLIRNRIIDVQDLSYEAQAFCIEFSRVREAAALFRLLKTLENGHQGDDAGR